MKKATSLIVIVVLVLIVIGFFWLRGGSSAAPVTPRAIAPETGVKIIAFGDSLTAGYGLSASEGYPAQLEAALRAEGLSVTVINSGVSGETTRGNLERAAFIRNQNPDLVLLGIGGNDALRQLPIEETQKNIEETITTLQGGVNPPVVVLLEMQAPLNAGLGYKRAFDSMYEEIAAKYSLELLPFITADVFLRSEFKLSDGIHYNEAGYAEVINRYLLEPIAEIVKTMSET